MLKGKTKSGFSFEVDEKNFDNMELLELFAEVDKNELLLPKVIKLYIGEEQKNKLYDHLRTKKGNVPIEKTLKEFLEIMEITKGEQEVKN